MIEVSISKITWFYKINNCYGKSKCGAWNLHSIRFEGDYIRIINIYITKKNILCGNYLVLIPRHKKRLIILKTLKFSSIIYCIVLYRFTLGYDKGKYKGQVKNT